METTHPIGTRLREWRQRRHLSQLDLALDAEISTRHLSFVETGRSAPSRDMVLRLAAELDVPLRERNALLLAAGYAPVYADRSLDDASFKTVRAAIEILLKAHDPFPALAIDRYWNLVTANRAGMALMQGVASHLLEPPVNVLRVSLHPDGAASRIENLAEWRAHLLHRLRKQFEASADPKLLDLLDELKGYPAPPPHSPDPAAIAVPLCVRSERGTMSFLSTTMLFGTPLDVSLSELAIEIFLPADAATVDLLRQLGP
ncbi:MAG TPA: helix-turn-helix transcriptional regulator [Devosiaceae bacterium]|nr:helix-turn-helix transcriptional regulator [Devosiaceae bacterium]